MPGPTNGELQIQVHQRLLEEVLNKQREFVTHMNLLEEVVFRCKPGGELTLINPAWARIMGWSEHETLGKNLCDFLAAGESRDCLIEALEAGQPIAQDIRLFTRFQESRTFRLRAQRDTDWYGSLQDVTDLSRAIEALEASQARAEKLSLVASRTDNLVIITDALGRIDWANASFEQTTGYTLAEVRGKIPGTVLQGPDTDHEAIQTMANGIQQQTGFTVEVINYTKQGRAYWISIDCSPVFDEQGELSNFIAIERDISEKKKSEQFLEESERQHRQILSSVSEPIFRCNDQLTISFMNEAWTKAIAADRNQTLPIKLLDVIHQDDHQEVSESARRALNGKEPVRQEIRMASVDGGWRRMELVLAKAPGRDVEDRSTITGAAIDIEEHWQVTQSIMLAKQQAEELSQARTRFVANMSHEIRTPLNAIIGMTSVLETTTLNEQQQLCLDTIRNGGKTLLSVVNDILDFAKLDQGEVELDVTKFSWSDLFEEVADLVAAEVDDKGLSLTLHGSDKMPPAMRGDLHRLRQILLNTLSNAVKFTARGSIEVWTDWLADGAETGNSSDSQGLLCFTVTDTGTGIAEDRLATLFNPFTQADGSITRNFGGTGLGLAICKQLCNQLGGVIEATSELGRGTVMKVQIPVTGTTASALAPAQGKTDADTQNGPSVAETRILVAEDSLANQLVIEAMLNQLGYTNVTIVSDGQQALNVMGAQVVDLVLLDIHMPVMDGFTAARSIRDNSDIAQPVIFALTADVTTDAINTANDVGIDLWVSKPITGAALKEAFAKLPEIKANPGAATRSKTPFLKGAQL